LDFSFCRYLDRLKRSQVFIAQITLGLERFNCRRVVHINALQSLQAGEFIKVLQHVLNAQIVAKQLHKGFFVGLLFNCCGVRKTLFQLPHHVHKATPRFTGKHIGKAFHIFLITLLQHHVPGVLVTEQGDGVDGRLLQIAESDDIAEGLGGVKNAVGARVGLHQTVVAQVLIDEQGVQGRRIEAGQEHADDDQQVDFLGFHLLGQIAVIVLEAVAIHAEIGLEKRVVIGDGGAQELLGAAAQG